MTMLSRATATHLLALAFGASAGWIALSQVDPGRGPSFVRDAPDPRSGPLPAKSPQQRTPGHGTTAATCREAWEALQKRSKQERLALGPPLLAEWLKRDLAGALEAALGSDDDGYPLQLFSAEFARDPQAFLDLIKAGRFGLRTAFLRDWYVRMMVGTDPKTLLLQSADLGPVSRVRIAEGVAGLLRYQSDQRDELIAFVATLPGTPENRELQASMGRELAQKIGSEELLVWLSEIPGPVGVAMIGSAVAVILEQADYDKAGETFGQLPDHLRTAAVESILSKPGKSLFGYLAAIDEMIDTPAWSERHRELATRLPGMSPDPRQKATLSTWAAGLPEREDTMELYRTAVGRVIPSDPDAARDWIFSQPSGWKRQNSLAAFARSALADRGDEAAARWAYEQITDPVVKSQAEGLLLKFENGGIPR